MSVMSLWDGDSDEPPGAFVCKGHRKLRGDRELALSSDDGTFTYSRADPGVCAVCMDLSVLLSRHLPLLRFVQGSARRKNLQISSIGA